jgi:hypothetical protein
MFNPFPVNHDSGLIEGSLELSFRYKNLVRSPVHPANK